MFSKKYFSYKKIFLIVLLLISSIYYINSKNTTKKTAILQEDIASKILRFHVIANSNTSSDQALKLKVKDAVINYLEPLTTSCDTINKTQDSINSHIDDIVLLSKSVILDNNFNYSVTAYIDYCTFPVKVYGDLTLPAGKYKALIINIGKSLGKNWWCVLFPNICFVDCTYCIVPDSSKNKFKNLLTSEEYALIFDSSKKSNINYELKFLTFLRKFFHN